MNTSKEINELAAALSLAQGSMGGAKKTSINPFFRSKYSSLSEVIDALRIPFADNGLSFVQGAGFEDGMISITTRILHKSGEWVQATTLLPIVKSDPQGFGSAFTYGRRYGLQALAGLPSVDDDAQSATDAMIEQNAEATKKHEDELRQITSMDELLSTWKSIPGKYKAALAEVKDELKAKLNAKFFEDDKEK